MSDTKPSSLAEKFKLLPGTAPVSDVTLDDDQLEEEKGYRAFVAMRQAHGRAAMLELVSKTGNRQAFAYSHLYHVEYSDPNEIQLYFTDHRVVISGLRLLDGFRRLVQQRVMRIVEADKPTAQLVDDDHAVITGIETRVLGNPGQERLGLGGGPSHNI